MIILLKASMTIVKRKGDSGFPYLNPRELLKKPTGEPFTKTEKRIKDMQCAIQENHFPPKPHLFNIYKRKFQLTWSKAFAISNLQSNPGSPNLR
jgi:hypothetical protein